MAVILTRYSYGSETASKEIRYGRDYSELERELGFLRVLCPSLKVIFNTRDTEECTKSSWWAEQPDESRVVLNGIRANVERYANEHPGRSYWMPYEALRRGSAELRGMFEYLCIEWRAEYETALDVVLR
jgi:hypothetical protein